MWIAVGEPHVPAKAIAGALARLAARPCGRTEALLDGREAHQYSSIPDNPHQRLGGLIALAVLKVNWQMRVC